MLFPPWLVCLSAGAKAKPDSLGIFFFPQTLLSEPQVDPVLPSLGLGLLLWPTQCARQDGVGCADSALPQTIQKVFSVILSRVLIKVEKWNSLRPSTSEKLHQ